MRFLTGFLVANLLALLAVGLGMSLYWIVEATGHSEILFFLGIGLLGGFVAVVGE